MTTGIDLNAVPGDFPQGVNSREGWFCRACGDPMVLNGMIYRPQGVWIDEKCFKGGFYTANSAGAAQKRAAQTQAQQDARAKAAAAAKAAAGYGGTQQRPPNNFNAQRAPQPPPPPKPNPNAAGQAWDAFFKSQKAKPPPSSSHHYADDEYVAPKPQTASDVEEVNEENWIEIVFEIIPDTHLKRMFSAMSKTYHPDVGGSDDYQRRINAAYQGRKKESL